MERARIIIIPDSQRRRNIIKYAAEQRDNAAGAVNLNLLLSFGINQKYICTLPDAQYKIKCRRVLIIIYEVYCAWSSINTRRLDLL